MRRMIFPAAVTGFYLGNRFFLIPHTSGILHCFLAWYSDDLLAGAVMLFVLNSLLAAVHRPPVTSIPAATALILGCGCFWEFVTPLYLPRSVSDPWDLAAYWAGAMGYLAAVRLLKKPRKRPAAKP